MVATPLTVAMELEFCSEQDAKSFELRLDRHERKLAILWDEVTCLERLAKPAQSRSESATKSLAQNVPEACTKMRDTKSVAPFPEACTKTRDAHLDRRAVKIPAVLARRADSARRTVRSVSSSSQRSGVGKSMERRPLSDAEARDEQMRAVQDKYGPLTRVSGSTDVVAPEIVTPPAVVFSSSDDVAARDSLILQRDSLISRRDALIRSQPVSEVNARDALISRKCQRFPSLNARSAAAVASEPAAVAVSKEKRAAEGSSVSPQRSSRGGGDDAVDTRDRILDKMRVRRGLA